MADDAVVRPKADDGVRPKADDAVAHPILVAQGLHYAYDGGVAALTDLNLSIRAGVRLALAGSNGAGKTTLLLHLNGTLKPKRGTVHLNGVPASYSRRGLTAWRELVGLVFQNPDDQLFAGSVLQDVSFGLLNLGMDEAEARERVEETLSMLGISHLRDRPTHMLSFGQKKRASIAGAVAMRPKVLIIDEPLAGLDPSGAEQFLEVLEAVHAGGTTIIVATHDMDLAYEWADEIAVIHEGRVAAQGEPGLIMSDDDRMRGWGLRLPWVRDRLCDACRIASPGWCAAAEKTPRGRGKHRRAQGCRRRRVSRRRRR